MKLPEPLDYTKFIPIEACAHLEHALPYCYELEAGKSSVYILGAEHSNDSAHEQFALLKQLFEDRLPSCILLEGIQDELVFAHLHTIINKLDTVAAIMRGGEAVYAAQLALAAGTTWQSIEPTDTELFFYLEKFGYTRGEIIAWALLRLLPQYIRRSEVLHFADYVEPFLTQLKRATEWPELMIESRVLLSEAAVFVGGNIKLHSERAALSYTSPLATANRDHDYTVLNTIAATATEYRDRAMVRNIISASAHFTSLLVVYGASHAVRQEPVLRQYFSNYLPQVISEADN